MRPRHYLLCASWVLGIACYTLLSACWPFLSLGLLLILAAAWKFGWRQRQWLFCLACLALFSTALLWTHLRRPLPARTDAVQLAPLAQGRFIGRVSSDLVKKGPQRWSLDLELEQLSSPQERPLSGKVKVQLKADKAPQLRIGERVELSGRLDKPQVAQNFGAFSYRDYLRQQGIFSLIYAQQINSLSQARPWHPAYWLQGLRLQILGGYEKYLPVDQARLLGSLLLGASASPVSEQTQELFQATGLQHVLAVSGFQVQLLVMGTMALCLLLKIPRLGTALLSLGLLWIFVALTGFPASVLRAGVLASLGLLGYVRFRELDPLAGLSIGCCGLLLVNPWLLYDLGFQFSVLATLGLMLGTPWIIEKLDFLPLPISGLFAPILAAQISVFPLQLMHFGSFSWLFLPANLLAGLLTTALSWLAIAAAALTWLSSLEQWVLMPAGWLISLFIWALKGLLKLPSPVLQGPQLALPLMLLAYALLGLILLLKKSSQPQLKMAICAVMLSMPLIMAGLNLSERQSCPVRITLISVGQGDAALIEAAGQVILIDAGPRWQKADGSWQDAGQKDILPYLQRRGIHHLDLAILSHPHLDHFGGYLSLVQQLPIRRFIGIPGSGDNQAYQELLKMIQQKGIPFEYAGQGSIRTLSANPQDQLKLIFWQPLADDQASINDQSLAVQLVHQNFRMLFSGDLEAAGENALLQTPGFEAQHNVLKVPHHGSLTSSTPEFLAAVRPQQAIISVGERNRYHHPAAEILERYTQAGIQTWRTDRNGAVCVCSRGSAYEMTVLNQEQNIQD